MTACAGQTRTGLSLILPSVPRAGGAARGLRRRTSKVDKFDFDIDEDYQFDRTRAEWLPDPAAVDDLWRKRVKNDILSLRLSGKPGSGNHADAAKRYEGIARRVAQMEPEDVFQAFINAYPERGAAYQLPCRRVFRKTSTSACACLSRG